MTTILNFNALILNLIELMKHLTSIEQDKLKAVTSKDLDALNLCIKNEQAQILKLRGLDKQREQIQESLGYKNLSFEEIISSLSPDEKEETNKLYLTLQQTTNTFKEINATIKTALDVNLHMIDAAMNRLNITPDNDPSTASSGNNLRNRFA